MKRFFALMAVVLGLASCQTEPEGLDVQMGGEIDTTITVSLPDTETRANSALGAFDNVVASNDYTIRYILQVYYGERPSNERLVKYSDSKEVNFDVRLVPGRAYNFVAWADVVMQNGKTLDQLSVYDANADLHYDTADLTNITLEDTWVAMDETRDAFTDFEVVTNFNAASVINLTLKRPLAKLRVLTTDMQALSNLGLRPQKAVVKYNANHYSSFNACTGKPTNKDIAEKVHTIANVATYGEEGTLFVDYFFATTEQEATKFELTVYDQNGDADVNKIKYNNFNTDIAVRRNYLTTIQGNILTDGNNIKVTVEDAFENVDDNGNTTNPDYEYKTISSDKEFLTAVNTPGKYIVISNLHIANEGDTVNNGQISTLSTRAGNTTIIDLNGKTITVENKGDGALASVAAGNYLVITNTVDGGKIELTEGSKGAFIENNGTVVIENGNIKSNSTNDAPVIDNNGTTNITGGVIGDNVVENTENGDVNITGGKLEGDDFDDFINDDYTKDENNEIVKKPTIAKIGDAEYTSLIKAVKAVEDGDTIILEANEKFTEGNRTLNSGSWYDGLYYIGDKSFTIDLNGKTISHDDSVNDYLLNFKNVGSKANTITIKNGTLNAGTTAFCALCTASSNENQLTINLEDVTIYNNRSNGSTAKIRGGAILNVKAGAKIIGLDSYLGIECVASTVNIYDGAEIYMNGTSSYNGCLAGACGGGTINVYGGYGKGVKGGFIAMTSGGTINVSGGEWIANTDGSIGNNSNLYVLTAQSNKNESGFVGGAYINVTGGTFRGGMDAWVLNNVEGEEAKLSISGGNFNTNPTSYLAEGCEVAEANGVWTVSYNPYYDYDNVSEGLLRKGNAYVVNNANGLATLNAMMVNKTAGKKISVSLNADIDFTGKTWTPVDSHVDFGFEIAELNGNGHTISNLTIKGQAMFTRFAGFGDVTIKDVTFDNANVNSNGNINTSILTVQSYQNVLLDNVDVKNSTIIGGYKVAPLIGTVYNEKPSAICATLKNCDVENVTVKATAYDFGTTGMVAFVYEGDNDSIAFENCSVKNVSLYAPNTYGYELHAAIYTNDKDTDDLINETEGVNVDNVTFTLIQ